MFWSVGQTKRNTKLEYTSYQNLFVYRSKSSVFTGVPGVSIAYKEAIADTTQPKNPNQALTKGHLNPSADSFDKNS